MIGVRADGKKELVALTDGYRESTESWAALLREAKGRGMRAPVLAMGGGALGFWAALRDVLLEFYNYRPNTGCTWRPTNPIVIWSRSLGVFDVHDGTDRSRDLCAGRVYLPLSSTWVFGRFDVRFAGGGAVVAA